MTDEPDVTGNEDTPSPDQRMGVLEDAVGLAHQRIRDLQHAASANEVQVIILAVGLILLAGAIYLIVQEGEVTPDVPAA